MKHTIITAILTLFACATTAQSAVVLTSLKLLPNSQADMMYRNEFGKFINNDLDDTFPYVVIQMELEGDVREAKTMLNLDLGTSYHIAATDKNRDNTILFLLPRGARSIYLLCGDGCVKQELHYGDLIENKVYTCKVNFSANKQSVASSDEMAEMKKKMEEMEKRLLAMSNNQQQGVEYNRKVRNIGKEQKKGEQINETIPEKEELLIADGVLIKVPRDFEGEFVVDNNVKVIGDSAFKKCKKLTSVIIPNGVTSIGESAFRECSALASVTLPNSVTNISLAAFFKCTSLESIVIPDSVTIINGYTFFGCSGLKSVKITDNVKDIDPSAFEGCTGIAEPLYNKTLFIYMPETYQGSYTIPFGIRRIVGKAFWNCTGLTNVTIPGSVDKIGWLAFYGCTGLTNVTIPNYVTSIEKGAFYGCTGLTDVILPNLLYRLEESVFEGCTSLKKITLPNGLGIIGQRVFAGCSGLSSVTIPKKTAMICQNAFEKCAGLTSVSFHGSATELSNKEVFLDCVNLQTIYVPQGTRQHYKKMLPSELKDKVIEQ